MLKAILNWFKAWLDEDKKQPGYNPIDLVKTPCFSKLQNFGLAVNDNLLARDRVHSAEDNVGKNRGKGFNARTLQEFYIHSKFRVKQKYNTKLSWEDWKSWCALIETNDSRVTWIVKKGESWLCSINFNGRNYYVFVRKNTVTTVISEADGQRKKAAQN